MILIKKQIIFSFIVLGLLTGAACSNTAQLNGQPGVSPNQTRVDLSNKNLNKIDAEFFNDNTQIEELNLSNNNLTGALPAEIRKLTKLSILNISNNRMTGLPAEIGQLANLEILNVSNNQLTGLPYELGNLKKLKTFDIRGNNYSVQDLNRIKNSLPKTTSVITD